MSADFIWQILGGVAFAGSIYGAIRADLKMIHERIKKHEDDIGAVHKRMDEHMQWHATKHN